MSDIIPDDWVLLEAAKRADWYTFSTKQDEILLQLREDYVHPQGAFGPLCDMIAKHEQPPVDRKVLCAREAYNSKVYSLWPSSMIYDMEAACLRAIELWEEGFGA